MRKLTAVGAGGFLFLSFFSPSQNRHLACLPKDVKPNEVVSTRSVASASENEVVKKTTVKQKLTELKARCRKGKLVDSSGKEIHFYRLAGCWGNPPADLQEILAQQESEIEGLKKRYRVIELECIAARQIQ